MTSVRGNPVFLKESAVFQLRMRAETLPRFALEFSFDSGECVKSDFITHAEQRIDVRIKPERRGIFIPGSLTVATRYPFGLVRCRFKLDLDAECLVYPEPLPSAFNFVNYFDRSDVDGQPEGDGMDDFKGFKAYQPGDPLKHVAWKAFARGQGLLVKEFFKQAESAVLIDWFALPEMDIEKKISLLCGMLLKADRLKLNYGLRLPGRDIEPDSSIQHKHDCLRALALFGVKQDA